MRSIEPDRIYHYTELPGLIPGHPSLSTVRRWINRGVKNGGFRKIKQHARAGRDIFVTGQSVIEFLSFDPSECRQSRCRRTAAQRTRAARDAAAKLEKLGS